MCHVRGVNGELVYIKSCPYADVPPLVTLAAKLEGRSGPWLDQPAWLDEVFELQTRLRRQARES